MPLGKASLGSLKSFGGCGTMCFSALFVGMSFAHILGVHDYGFGRIGNGQ